MTNSFKLMFDVLTGSSLFGTTQPGLIPYKELGQVCCFLHLCYTWSGFRVDFGAVRWGTGCACCNKQSSKTSTEKVFVCLCLLTEDMPLTGTSFGTLVKATLGSWRGSTIKNRACHLGTPPARTGHEKDGGQSRCRVAVHDLTKSAHQESTLWDFSISDGRESLKRVLKNIQPTAGLGIY